MKILCTSKNLQVVLFEIYSQHTGRRKHAFFSRNSSRSQSSSAHHHQGQVRPQLISVVVNTLAVQEMWDFYDHICTQFKAHRRLYFSPQCFEIMNLQPNKKYVFCSTLVLQL